MGGGGGHAERQAREQTRNRPGTDGEAGQAGERAAPHVSGLGENAGVLHVLLATFPFFALILAGYLAARCGLLRLEAIPGLNGFVLYFALPCMLFRFGAAAPIAELLDGTVALVYLLCACTMVAVAVAVARRRRMGWNDAAFGALVAAFPNTGFMGVPVLVALLGSGVVGTVIQTILIDMVLTTSLCVALSRLDGQGQQGFVAAGRNALRGVLRNPMPWAILLGGLASVLALRLPAPVDQTIRLLADAASPVALFTIGAVLARARVQELAGNARAARVSDYLPVALQKLLLHPLLVLAVGTFAIALGLALRPETLVTLVLIAALPSASNVSMLAERFGANNGHIARIILVSTMIAFFSFPALVSMVAGTR